MFVYAFVFDPAFVINLYASLSGSALFSLKKRAGCFTFIVLFCFMFVVFVFDLLLVAL